MKDKEYGAWLHPMRFLVGYKRIGMPRSQLEAALGVCIGIGISYFGVRSDEERGSLCVPFFSSRRLIKALSGNGIDAEVCDSGGAPALIASGRSRLGIPIGLILGITLIFFSGLFVWDIRVDGCERLTEAQVEETLGHCGLKVGSRIDGLDIDVIENRALILSDDISWISVNMRGTVANVEIRELDKALEEEKYDASNIVAGEGGVIEQLENIRGMAVVNVGDAVSEGQILISGIYGDELSGIGCTDAKGRVIARCEGSFSVEIPRKYQKKVYTGEVRCEKYLIFFKKEIKFFTNYRNSYTTCDKIDIVEYLSAPGGDDLPVGIRTVRYLEYTYEDAERSDEEMARIARYRADAMLVSLLCDGELLRKSVSIEMSEDVCLLNCRYRCLKDIAKKRPIEVTRQ